MKGKYLVLNEDEKEALAILLLTGDIADLALLNLSFYDDLPDKTRIRLIDEYGRLYNKLKQLVLDVEEVRVPVAEVAISEDDVEDDWIEFNTDGIVYGKVIGKKSYAFTPAIQEYVIIRYRDGTEVFHKFNVPTFEVFVDILSFKLPDGRTVRRFWEWRGKIEIYYTARLKNGKLFREKIGEITVDWLGHEELNKDAERIVRRLKKIKRELIEKRMHAKGIEKAKLTREIKKVEEKIQYYCKLKQRHYAVGVRVWGRLGDERIEDEILAPVALERDRLAWGNQELLVMKKNELDNFVVKHETVVEREYQFYGRKGKLNHRLKIAGIPRRKVAVNAWVQTRPEYYKRRLEVRKHPVIVKEIEANCKVWVIEPVDNVSRVILHSKDHAREGLDRILIHLDNEVMVFIHKL